MITTPDIALPAKTLAASTVVLPPAEPHAFLGPISSHDSVDNPFSPATTPDDPPRGDEDEKGDKDMSPDVFPTLPRTSSSLDHAIPARKLSTARLIGIGTVATFTMILSSMGNVILNIALPTIQIDLGMTESNLQWISSAYSLAFGCFLLLSGRLADIHGRKLVFLVGVCWYAAWTLVGPFFKSGAGLVVARALAGAGAAMS
jgi:hypothetical protein